MISSPFLQECKTNANYENLVYDKVEKRVTKNLFYDARLTIEFFATVTLFTTLSYTKFP